MKHKPCLRENLPSLSSIPVKVDMECFTSGAHRRFVWQKLFTQKKASSGCHEDHSPELKDLCKSNQITWLLVNTALKFRDIDCEIRLDSVSLIYKLTIPDLTIIVGL